MDTPEQVESGQPQVTQVTAMNAPEPTQTAAPEPTKQDASTAKYGGKTVDDLASELAEKDRYIQEVHERAARAEHEALLTRNLVEQFSRDRAKPEPTVPDEPQIGEEDLITNPKGVFVKGFQWMESKMRAERQKEQAIQYVNSAKTSFERGKEAAVKANPNLYSGIEQSVANAVLAQVQESYKAGQPMDPGLLNNSEYWALAAIAERISRGETMKSVLSKYYTEKPTGMTAGHTETPTAGLPPQAGTSLTQGEIAMAQFLGGTPEQYAAAKAKGK